MGPTELRCNFGMAWSEALGEAAVMAYARQAMGQKYLVTPHAQR